MLGVPQTPSGHMTLSHLPKFNNVGEELNLLVRCFIVLNFMETNGNGKKRKTNSKYGEVILRV